MDEFGMERREGECVADETKPILAGREIGRSLNL